MPNRNSETLLDFMLFCRRNPELRFWQALSAWTGKIVYLSSMSKVQVESYKERDDEVEGLKYFLEEAKDTFYREGKDEDIRSVDTGGEAVNNNSPSSGE